MPWSGRLMMRKLRLDIFTGKLAVLCWVGLGAVGCSPVLRSDQASRGEQVDVDAFLHEHLQQVPMVTVAEAYRAMLVLADGEDAYPDFAARQAALFERGVARPQKPTMRPPAYFLAAHGPKPISLHWSLT